jgi:hypothetical protein
MMKMITVNGSAEIKDAVCKAFRPPATNRTAAIAAIKKPQIILTTNDGVKLPFDVILAKIYVAESADVTKKVKISRIDNRDKTVVNGKCK